MADLVLEHTVEKSREGSYYSLPFQVPEGVAALTVSYRYPRLAAGEKPPVNVIDLGLENAEGQFLGWSGSSRRSVTAGEFTATPGYRMARVRPGVWHILVGAYHVQEGGVPVRYEISFEKKGPRWLFGDLHVHSTASDGQYDVPTLARKARAMGLDFLSVTDHNNYAENFSLPKIQGLTLIPGTEWTHYKGHMNFFGLKEPFTGSFIANDLADMRRIVKDAADRGALVSVNHPRCNLCPYLWEDESVFAAVEIWNGPMRNTNREGIRWWTELLRQGRRLPALGGSDYHRSHRAVRLGIPVTAVYADSPAPEDILSALRAGRSYVTGSIKGVRLNMTCGDVMLGGTAQERTVSVWAERLPPGAVVQLTGRDGMMAQLEAKGGQVRRELSLPETSFVYLTAGTPAALRRGMPLAVSNPIYFERG